MTQVINQETVELLAFEENLQLSNGCSEYLLQTGAKLYPRQGIKPWRIVGYTATDVRYYIDRYELDA
jgi:hypothetical protein